MKHNIQNKTTCYFLIIIFLSISNINLFTQQSKESLYKNLEKKYGNIKSISFDYSMKEFPENKGSMKAKEGNKYIIKLTKRQIYSNGKTIWNVTHQDKKVVISELEVSDSKTITYENFFFDFFDLYKPKSLTKENSSKGQQKYILTLVPEPYDKDGTLDIIKVGVDIKSLGINYLQFINGKETQTFEIKNISINPKLSDKVFEYVPEKDYDVIDLR